MSGDVVDRLRDLGGVARWGALGVRRAELARAVDAGVVVRDARGLYVLPGLEDDLRAAARLGGQVSHTSAALRHGWAVKTVPRLPHVTVSRGRRLPRDTRAVVHRAELPAGQITSVETTLDQCLRQLPFDEALAVADSALREGLDPGTLAALARGARGPGSRQLRRVAAAASPRAANPFESVLRAIALDVPGLAVRPQVAVLSTRPDLVDERLRIIAEADSFAWHGSRVALDRDCGRYNMLVVHGWTVLRFSYEAVMRRPAEVRETLVAAVGTKVLNERRPRARPAA